MAIDFDGTDDYIKWANVLDLAGSALSISFWTQIDQVANPAYIFSIDRATDNDVYLILKQKTGDPTILQFSRFSTGAGFKSRESATGTLAAAATTWVHYCVTDNGTFASGAGIKIYEDGAEVSYNGAPTDGSGTEAALDSEWVIGRYDLAGAQFFNGRLAEFAVWNRELSAAEVSFLANGFSPLFALDGLKFYSDLIGRLSEINFLGAPSSTTVGTTTAEHPRIIYPSNPLMSMDAFIYPSSPRRMGVPYADSVRPFGRSW